jgi:glycosidase
MNIRLSYQPLTAGKYEVGIAGDFTRWKILSLQNFGGLYLIDFDLKPGRYRYKFIVDGIWKTDPANPKQEPDPYGGMNSILELRKERSIDSWEEALLIAAEQDARSFISCHRPKLDSLELRFSWYQNFADQVEIIFSDASFPLSFLGRKGTLSFWHIELKISSPRRFHIRLSYREHHVYLGLEGLSSELRQSPPLMIDPSLYPVFEIPEILKSGIVYQIFTDRFFNGDKSNDPDFSEPYYEGCKEAPEPGTLLSPNQEYYHLVKDWENISGLQQSPWREEGIPDWYSFYGGDIAGVIQKLDYLIDMGINIIYFNPLWQAKSNHKYDAADFMKPDPHFASVAELKELTELAHQNGIRIILDVAFNHSGESFWAFRDTVEKGEASRWWNWYDWFRWPLPKPLPEDFKPRDYYQCWWGIKDMPDLNYDLSRKHPYENYIRDINNADVNWPLVNHILDAASWWIEEIHMDGFRLDVPDEVPWWFWQLFRQKIKDLNPEAWLVGEIWHKADDWVDPRYFDSVMNYAYFKNPVLEFFIQKLCDREEFKQRIEEGLVVYPAHASRAMMNLLGSHDTLRLKNLAKGDYPAMRRAIFFQMTFIGIPHIYYGDEIAMPGGNDPDNRRPFNWDWQKDEKACALKDFYQSLIEIRKQNAIFIEGEFLFLDCAPGMLLYKRYLEDDSLVCAINYSDQDKILPSKGTVIFHDPPGTNGAEGIVLPAGGTCIVQPI